MIGSGGGGGGAAAAERRIEEARQRQIQEGVGRVNAIFSGGKYGTGAVDPLSVEYGRQYFDKAGNPVTLSPQRALVPGATMGGGTADRNQAAPATRPGYRNVPASEYFSSAFGNTPLYTGVGESKGYDDAYFGDIADAFSAHYMPLVQEQYERARRGLTLNAPSRGSGYLRALGDLDTDYARERVNVGERALGAANEARADVESNRADLIRAAEGGSAPDLLAQRAVAAQKQLAAPKPYDPLGDLFSRTATTVANARNAQRAGYEFRDPPLIFGGSGRRRAVTTVP